MSAPWLEGVNTRNLFFTGKGGVGKTSLACATAIALAESGLRTLIVSTDPASNLDEVLGAELAGEPRPVPGIPHLSGMNIDPEEAARRYRERAIGPYRGLLPEAAIRSMEEGLSGACTTEIAAFDEFTALLGGDESARGFDRVVFDTAPTGHTLRLLSLPAAWTGFIENNTSGVSCLGPLSALQKQEAVYRSSVDALKDANQTSVFLVARPDELSLREAARAAGELADLGVASMRLIVNGVFIPTVHDDRLADALAARGRKALEGMPPVLGGLPRATVPLMPNNLVGITALRQLLAWEQAVGDSGELPQFARVELSRLVDEIESEGHGVIMTMGKGGVGKTTVAVEIATELASRGHSVLLTTTDPAAHVADAARARPATLRVERIDPAAEVARYTAEVMATAGAGVDEEGRALLEEDLRSPCTEEIAVFRAFAEAVALGGQQFVVVDTAPTGHTVLLLDAAEAYHRDVLRSSTEMPESVRELLPRLRDPRFTRVIIVALPEPTPVHEAAKLQEDLRRAEIEPFAWVVNQSLALASPVDPVLRSKAVQERGPVDEVKALTQRIAILPWRAEFGSGSSLSREGNLMRVQSIARRGSTRLPPTVWRDL